MAIVTSGTTVRGQRVATVLSSAISEGAPLVFTFAGYDPNTAFGDFCAWTLAKPVPGLSAAPAVFEDGFIRYPLYSVRVNRPLESGDVLTLRFYFSGLGYTVETY